mmetsp:Transcript_6307/g.23762  ORF Transcript_6307/g.23762 Transcript_6307/m.23762 type:complete len:100 (-) Transcript_6307:2240-2539(-)
MILSHRYRSISKSTNSTFLFRNTFIPTRDNTRVQFFDTHKFDVLCLKNLKRNVSSESAQLPLIAHQRMLSRLTLIAIEFFDDLHNHLTILSRIPQPWAM